MIIKEVNNKIKIISNINKLSNTLSMISLSKMNKLLKLIVTLDKLNNKAKIILTKIYKFKKGINYCIVVTTNKGLCGNINIEILKKTLNFLKNNKNLNLIIIGKKGIDFFFKKKITTKYNIIFNDNEKIENIFFKKEIIDLLINSRNIYFVSINIQNNILKPIITNLFYFDKKNEYLNINNFNYIFFIKNYINYSLKNIYIKNIFCELKSRMITMKSASDNSKTIIKNMKIIKNKIRQFKVTQDMLEIINGSNL
uniref:ATP synthase gamma subunit n=1 Tax=Carsonella ruddii TaxID=114186 RepID=A0A172QF14_CARRU|nr:ATP synthase gamma subunit [Candidatus Carsonella ruddii]